MGNIPLALFLLAITVNMYASQDIATEDSLVDYDFDSLLELEKMYVRSKLIVDGEKQMLPGFEQMCYNAHQICTAIVPTSHSVCAQHEKHGLVDFPNICELRFQNCLTQAYETRTGNRSKTGLFYYNSEDKECQYYLERTSSLKTAIAFYFKDEIEIKMRRMLNKYNK